MEDNEMKMEIVDDLVITDGGIIIEGVTDDDEDVRREVVECKVEVHEDNLDGISSKQRAREARYQALKRSCLRIKEKNDQIAHEVKQSQKRAHQYQNLKKLPKEEVLKILEKKLGKHFSTGQLKCFLKGDWQKFDDDDDEMMLKFVEMKRHVTMMTYKKIKELKLFPMPGIKRLKSYCESKSIQFPTLQKESQEQFARKQREKRRLHQAKKENQKSERAESWQCALLPCQRLVASKEALIVTNKHEWASSYSLIAGQRICLSHFSPEDLTDDKGGRKRLKKPGRSPVLYMDQELTAVQTSEQAGHYIEMSTQDNVVFTLSYT